MKILAPEIWALDIDPEEQNGHDEKYPGFWAVNPSYP
jgi:hypothetical protein